jgi:hypothetical protein
MKKLLVSGLIFLLATEHRLEAQSDSSIFFPVQRFDMGEIQEEDGIVYHVFSFVNKGKDTLLPLSAKGHCHCTTGDMLDSFVAPGKTGKVRVKYDPKGRPWPFDVGIDLLLKNKKKITLHLSGSVGKSRKAVRFSPVEFIQRFDFNEKSIEAGEEKFRDFVEGLLPLLERHGDLKVRIESSASTVPTKSFASNEDLTQARAEAAKAEILHIILAAGAPENRLQFEPFDTKIQGPEYHPERKLSYKEFTPFQYVKIRVY